MLKSYKTEIDPNPEQINIIKRTIGVCRFVYNFFLAYNDENYKQGNKFITSSQFSKWLNNEFIPNNPNYSWIKEVSSKSVKQSIINAEKAYKNFFKGISNFPKFKKKNDSNVKMYFVRENVNRVIMCERHRIKVPSLGWIKIKEKGYLPITKDNIYIKSGTISYEAGKYYISVLVDINNFQDNHIDNNVNGLGIDLGIKDFVILSNGTVYKNINKTKQLKKLKMKLVREQRSLSRMFENKRKEQNSSEKNINKQQLKIQKIYHKIKQIKTDYINKVIIEIVKTKPSYIVIEDLNVSGMMKNHLLAKAIQEQNFYEFRKRLNNKCIENNIELRLANRWFPSSKICNCCGSIKKDLKLSDRIYKCECGYINDRDLNAALNLRDCNDYVIAL